MGTTSWKDTFFFTYPFLTVFHPSMDCPFQWQQVHIDQGFTWRPEGVAFVTRYHKDLVTVTITLQQHYIASSTAVRIIKVPFTIPAEGIIVASPPTNPELKPPIPPRMYSLYYEIDSDTDEADHDEAWKYSLCFVPTTKSVQAEIIRKDGFMSPPETLVLV